jgi:FG-GAP-like repeat
MRRAYRASAPDDGCSKGRIKRIKWTRTDDAVRAQVEEVSALRVHGRSRSGDIDGDTDPDIAVTNGDGNVVSALLNNGDGTFATAASYGVVTALRG